MNEKDFKKLQRIAELARFFINSFVILCEKCDKPATDEAGDWSGSGYFCKEHLEQEIKHSPHPYSFNQEHFRELNQNPLVLELYQLLSNL